MSPSVAQLIADLQSGAVDKRNAEDAIRRAGGADLAILETVRALADGGGGGAPGGSTDWGEIGGTLSDQTDLQAALDAKVDDSAVSAFGATLIDDADAAAARTTLGLGTLATQNNITSNQLVNDFGSGGKILSAPAGLSGITYLSAGSSLTTAGATLDVAPNGITNAMLAGSIDLTTKVTGTLPVANGGTGQTSLASVDAADLGAGASSDGQVLMSDGSAGAAWEALPCEIGVACSNETTALTTGTAETFRMPYAMTLTAVRASVTTAPTGSTLIVDINEAGSSVLSTKLSIDAGEKTSTTAATAAVISDSALADDAEITIDIDQIGSTIAGAGLKVWLIGKRA